MESDLWPEGRPEAYDKLTDFHPIGDYLDRLAHPDLEAAMNGDLDDVPVRPIEPFPVTPVDPLKYMTELPAYSMRPAPVVHVSIIERGRVYIIKTVKYTRVSIAMLQFVVAAIDALQTLNPQEKGMINILKYGGKLTKIVGGAVSVGGFLMTWIPAPTAAAIFGVTQTLGNAIMFIGDLVDDGKLNNSFSLDENTDSGKVDPAAK